MCRRVECRKCGKPTWAGCGAHVEQVLGNVPAADRCQCCAELTKGRGSETPSDQRSWFSRLFNNEKTR
jgi:hypothetical protein